MATSLLAVATWSIAKKQFSYKPQYKKKNSFKTAHRMTVT